MTWGSVVGLGIMGIAAGALLWLYGEIDFDREER